MVIRILERGEIVKFPRARLITRAKLRFAHERGDLVFVHESPNNREPLGALIASDTGNLWYIESFYKGEGIGSELIAAYERWALARGIREISGEDVMVPAFYWRLGYETDPENPNRIFKHLFRRVGHIQRRSVRVRGHRRRH